MSCEVGDVLLFNSQFNLCSFLNSLHKRFHRRVPSDQEYGKFDDVIKRIEAKSTVMYYPIIPPPSSLLVDGTDSQRPLQVMWNHRWEWVRVRHPISAPLHLHTIACSSALHRILGGRPQRFSPVASDEEAMH